MALHEGECPQRSKFKHFVKKTADKVVFMRCL